MDDAVAQLLKAAAAGEELPELDDLETLPASVVQLVLDRIDAAYREGLFAMSAEDYSGLMCAIMPDEFSVPPCPPVPSQTIPLTRARTRIYAARVRAEVAIFHADDLRADQERSGLEVDWSIGRSLKVRGVKEEGAPSLIGKPRRRK